MSICPLGAPRVVERLDEIDETDHPVDHLQTARLTRLARRVVDGLEVGRTRSAVACRPPRGVRNTGDRLADRLDRLLSGSVNLRSCAASGLTKSLTKLPASTLTFSNLMLAVVDGLLLSDPDQLTPASMLTSAWKVGSADSAPLGLSS